MSKIEDELCKEFAWYCTNDSVANTFTDEVNARSSLGEIKYGVTLERTDLSKSQWFQHLKEELLDAANYATRLEMYEELTFSEKEILEILKRDLFHSIEQIYENSMFE
jgi:hypothetical protein